MMCLFLITIFLEPLHRLSSSSYRSKYPYRNGSSSSSTDTLPRYPASPYKRSRAGYQPHPLWPNRPASMPRQPVLVQDPRVDRLISAINANGGLGPGANGGVGINLGGFDGGGGGGGRGGAGSGSALNYGGGGNGVGGIRIQEPQQHQDQLPSYVLPQSPRQLYGDGGGLQVGDPGMGGQPYNDQRLNEGGNVRPVMDGWMADRMFNNGVRPNVGGALDYGGYQMQAPMPQDFGNQGMQYPGTQYTNFPQMRAAQDLEIQMGLRNMVQPQVPQRAELRGGRSLSPDYGHLPNMGISSMGMQVPFRQDLHAGHVHSPQQPWAQAREHDYIHDMPHTQAREELGRGLDLGARTTVQERSRGLGQTKPEGRPTARERRHDRSQETQHREAQEEVSRIFSSSPEQTHSKQKNTGKERESTRLGSPSRNPFAAFSRLRRRTSGERKDGESDKRENNKSNRPPEYDNDYGFRQANDEGETSRQGSDQLRYQQREEDGRD